MSPARRAAALGSSLAALLSLVLVATLTPSTAGPATSTGTSSSASTSSVSAKPKPKPNKPARYNPPAGVLFNNPYGTEEAERRIFRHLVRSIDSTKGGEKIRIASWNVRSGRMADAIIRAHRRGVSVRIVMDRVNATKGNPNSDVARIQKQLRMKNGKRAKDMTSWLHKCLSSCRYPKGIAHTKFYTFSAIGKVKDVVMYGSNNATDLAATIQWNDLYTLKESPTAYADFNGVFDEMARDSKVKNPFRRFTYGPNFSVDFYPFRGKEAEEIGDPTMQVLRKIRCTGATGGTGTNGRTKIRIAQTAMYGDRGKLLAQRLVALRRAGCDIRVVFAMFGDSVVKTLRGGGIGMTHLAWDSNEDGIYDRYVHMKSMALSGVYGKQTDARIVWNGSANWTSVALASDEVVGEIRHPAVTRKYMRAIDYMFTHRPRSWGSDDRGGSAAAKRSYAPSDPGPAVAPTARQRALPGHAGVDPYALIRREN